MSLKDHRLPHHVAIIMDGNGRWAQKNGVSTIWGHKIGADVAQNTVLHALKQGIQHLTLYTFSCENWHRDGAWVDDFLNLLRTYLRDEVFKLIKHGVRVSFIGDVSRFPVDIQNLMFNITRETETLTKMHIHLALSYGARNEIFRSIKKLIQQDRQSPLDLETFSENDVSLALDTGGTTDPDLMIRTSGEYRISNFLLWQMAYTEFVFTDVLWPDFSESDFDAAISEYQKRQRRYGNT